VFAYVGSIQNLKDLKLGLNLKDLKDLKDLPSCPPLPPHVPYVSFDFSRWRDSGRVCELINLPFPL